ncbi:MAG: hypothetical protein M9939_21530 [Mesorhizobium sp.]|nr:hypothetical protein [Mesorhizobium sp.]MCO5163716.1 hypothetical protein [Mesorhizobium sp.]
MAEVTNDLICEILKSIQGRMDKMEHGIGEIRHEVVSIRLTQMGIENDIHNMYGILARHDQRLDRIENRLDLRGLAEAQRPYDPT